MAKLVTITTMSVVSMFTCLVFGDFLPWSYDTVALWGEMATSDKSLFSEYQIKFAAENFKMVYVGKCLGGIKNYTEEQYYNTSSYLRKYASSDELTILVYFAVDTAYCDCYSSIHEFCNNKSMWFKDDYGNIIIDNGRGFYDYTQEYVRKYFANTVSSIMRTGIIDRNISVNGIFGDGMTKNMSMIYKNVSNQRANDWLTGVEETMNLTKELFNEITEISGDNNSTSNNNDLYIIGNAISTYKDNAPLYGSQVLPFVDGVAHCHYAEYEGVVDGLNGNGTLNTQLLLWAFNLSQSIAKGDYGGDKALWIKGWVGPGDTPMSGNGLTHGPSWPKLYGKTPNTTLEIQDAASKLLKYPLAIYLCGIYDKYTYFGYSWFWGTDSGWIPCPNDPTSCDAPKEFFKEFTSKLGEPKTRGIMTDTFKCNRSFENANVYVDIRDNTSAVIDFLS